MAFNIETVEKELNLDKMGIQGQVIALTVASIWEEQSLKDKKECYEALSADIEKMKSNEWIIERIDDLQSHSNEMEEMTKLLEMMNNDISMLELLSEPMRDGSEWN